MAILGDFEVVVSGPDGKPLPEFEDENAEEFLKNVQGPAIVKHLQAQADSNFSVTCKILSCHSVPAGSSIGFVVYRDDDLEDLSSLIACARTIGAFGWTGEVEDRCTQGDQGWQAQWFRFGPLELEEDQLANTTQDGKFKIGTLRIEVWAMSVIGRVDDVNWAPVATKNLYSEMDLKGATVGLCLQLDKAKPTSAPKVCKAKAVSKCPLATLFFEYRTRETLQHIGVLETEPSTVAIDPDDSENPPGDGTALGNDYSPDDNDSNSNNHGNLRAPDSAQAEVEQTDARGTKRKRSTDPARVTAKLQSLKDRIGKLQRGNALSKKDARAIHKRLKKNKQELKLLMGEVDKAIQAVGGVDQGSASGDELVE